MVDVDPRHGGDEALHDLERERGVLPQSVESKTGGGGRHVYLRCTEPIRSRTDALAKGIDIKADRGYVIAPPSTHPDTGRRYEWDLDPIEGELEPVLAWLLEALRKTVDKPHKSIHSGPILQESATRP